MANKNLEFLLIEYEEKRRRAEIELDKKKQEIYRKFPRV